MALLVFIIGLILIYLGLTNRVSDTAAKLFGAVKISGQAQGASASGGSLAAAAGTAMA